MPKLDKPSRAPLAARDINISSPKPNPLGKAKANNKTTQLAPDGKSQTAAGTKRGHVDEHDAAAEADDIDVEGMAMDANCDQVRRKINRFLDSGAMTKTAFSKHIQVSDKSLRTFLQQHGRDKGDCSAAYSEAWAFFKKRELAGVKMPTKKRKTDASDGSSGPRGKAAASTPDVTSIHLEGEEDDSVRVYDTCDEMRKKINAHLKLPGVAQAQFCRDLYAQLHGADKPKSIQSVLLSRFREKHGPRAGTTSSVFYAAYVFFEKLRLKEDKAKSKHRLEMERIWPGGFNRHRDASRG